MDQECRRPYGARSWRHGFCVSNHPFLALMTLGLEMVPYLLQSRQVGTAWLSSASKFGHA